VEKCPFCGQSLIEKEKKRDTLEAVLTEIVEELGIASLQNGKNLLGYVSDLAPSLKKERRFLSYLIECGGHTKIISALQKTSQEQILSVENVIFTLCDQWLLDKTITQTGCYTFYAAASGQPLEAVLKQKTPDIPAPSSASPAKEKSAFGSAIPTPSPEDFFQKGDQFYKDKEYAQAVEAFRKAAEQGYAKAQYRLGRCYHNGTGINQNASTAVYWYRKAAEQGYMLAQQTLGRCYKTGDGVPQNLNTAKEWYQKAWNAGSAMAKDDIAQVQNLLAKTPPNTLPVSTPSTSSNVSKSDLLSEQFLEFQPISGHGYKVQLQNGCFCPKQLQIPSHYQKKEVLKLNERAFLNCSYLESIEIPNTVIGIGAGALKNCSLLQKIIFTGTKKEWTAIQKGIEWNAGTGHFTVHCQDGTIPKSNA
jgi:tetratricopeptide (TPR) repeat protein